MKASLCLKAAEWPQVSQGLRRDEVIKENVFEECYKQPVLFVEFSVSASVSD